jgi:hypothetical protein
MIVHEQILWVVIGVFYLLQQVKFFQRNEAYVFVSRAGNAAAAIPAFPFETIKGVLYLVNPFVPHRVLFRCHWGMTDAPSSASSFSGSSSVAVRRAWLRMRRTSRNLGRFRVVAVLGWVLFFIICPVLTWQIGLERTLWLAIPAWILLYGTVVYLLLTHTFEGNRSVWLLLFECLVCPAYIAALPRLLEGKVIGAADLARLVKRYGTDAEWQRLKRVLEKRIETEVFNNPSRMHQLEAYRAEILQD